MKDSFRRGFTLIELLITIAFIAAFFTVLYGLYARVLQITTNIRMRIIASQLASEQVEFIRNLEYSLVGTVGGLPSGVVPHTSTFVRAGVSFAAVTTIRNIDQPADGTLGGSPNDLSPADTKLVVVEVTCDTCENPITISNTSYVAPKSLESANGNGAMVIKAIDASGQPIPDATVTITNTALTPAVNISDVTDSTGTLTIVDAPPSTERYQITVTKDEYSTERTYTPGDLANPNPLKPHSTVVANTVTQSTFAIDRTGSIILRGQSALCAPLTGVSGTLTGSKRIGTNPDVIKTTIPFTIASPTTLSNVEWDTYRAALSDTTYDIAGSNPLLPFTQSPGSNTNLTLTLKAHTSNRIVVAVVDQAGLPIAGATVTISGPSGTESEITNIGSVSQSDWSGGGGQAMFLDSTKYDTMTSLDATTVPGELSLLFFGGAYGASGTLESSTIDLGSAATLQEIQWLPVNQIQGLGATPVRFQIASNTDNATWNFVGPDGTNATYYTTAGQAITTGHTNHQFVRYKLFLSTTDMSKTPVLSDFSLVYTSGCLPPGQVDFGGISSGTYQITVTKDGYTDATKNSTINGTTYETITLTP